MCGEIAFLSFVKIKKQAFLVSLFLLMYLVSSVFGAEEYFWTGDGLDGKQILAFHKVSPL